MTSDNISLDEAIRLIKPDLGTDIFGNSGNLNDDLIISGKLGDSDVFLAIDPHYPEINTSCYKIYRVEMNTLHGPKMIRAIHNLEVPSMLRHFGFLGASISGYQSSGDLFAIPLPFYNTIKPETKNESMQLINGVIDIGLRTHIFMTGHPGITTKPFDYNKLTSEFFKPKLMKSEDHKLSKDMESFLESTAKEANSYGYPIDIHGDLNDCNAFYGWRYLKPFEFSNSHGRRLTYQDFKTNNGTDFKEEGIVLLDFDIARSVPETDIANYIVRFLTRPENGFTADEMKTNEGLLKESAPYLFAFNKFDYNQIRKKVNTDNKMPITLDSVDFEMNDGFEKRYKTMKIRQGLHGIRHYVKHLDKDPIRNAQHAINIFNFILPDMNRTERHVVTNYLKSTPFGKQYLHKE